MFCPEEYVSLYDSTMAFDSFAEEWWNEEGAALHAKERLADREDFARKNGNLSTYIDFGEDDVSPIIAYRWWAICRLIFRFDHRLLICSPHGKVMRIGNFLFGADRLFDGEFPKSLKDQRDFINVTHNIFWHLNNEYFIVQPCESVEIIQIYDLQAETEVLLHFKGWAICWKPRNRDDWRTELKAFLADDIQHQPLHRYTLGDERRAALKIVELYDNDNQVTKAICKTEITLGTLAFKRAWDMAKTLRPALGIGGRPKSKPQT